MNRTQRKLEQMHDDIALKHMPDGWCFNCHNPENRDTLRLANGRIVKFEESYLLCAQCHGPVFRDWKVGLHGKRTGMWNGEKQYRLCVNCHSPHAPPFKSLKPLPPPMRPSDRGKPAEIPRLLDGGPNAAIAAPVKSRQR